jgi:putative hydrolases of HD superfamily
MARELLQHCGDSGDLSKCISLIRAVDALKRVRRQTLIMSGHRRENSAEHSWHISLMVLLLHRILAPQADLQRCLVMAIIHDVVEVAAGDSDFHGTDPVRRAEEETAAAREIFSTLPGVLGKELLEIWTEFESAATLEAQFVKALDRFQPIVSEYVTRGHSWRRNAISPEKVKGAVEAWLARFPVLFSLASSMVHAAEAEGFFKPYANSNRQQLPRARRRPDGRKGRRTRPGGNAKI